VLCCVGTQFGGFEPQVLAYRLNWNGVCFLEPEPESEPGFPICLDKSDMRFIKKINAGLDIK
jgi:hypothetical protein